MAELRIAANWEVSGTSIWGVTPFNARVRIADVTLLAPSNGVNWVQHANLIAAAPDMLAALARAEAALDYVHRGSDDLRVSHDLEAIRAVIAKAEGL